MLYCVRPEATLAAVLESTCQVRNLVASIAVRTQSRRNELSAWNTAERGGRTQNFKSGCSLDRGRHMRIDLIGVTVLCMSAAVRENALVAAP